MVASGFPASLYMLLLLTAALAGCVDAVREEQEPVGLLLVLRS